MTTRRLTTAQALVGFLENQYVERDGLENPFFAGAWGIFGHGVVAGLGQALQEHPGFRYYLCRNEQAAVHIATAFAKARNRLGAFACVSSIGPGATNMVTGAAAATVNRLPVLLLPGDIFARRNVAPCSSNWKASTARTFPSTTASSRFPATGTASTGRTSFPARWWRPYAC